MAQDTRPLALVTGASTGIGYELAKCCAENGFDLLIAADEPRIAEAGDDFRKLGANVEAVQADLATLARRAKLVGPAITLCTATALLICLVIAVLFLSAFFPFDATVPVALLFIAAMLAFSLGLLWFLREIYVATTSLQIGFQRVHGRRARN